MLSKYKHEIKKLEEEKYNYTKKVAELEGAIAKYKIDLLKSEEEKIGYKERGWKAERDLELVRQERDKMRIEARDKGIAESNRHSGGYLSGWKKTMKTINPLSVIWGDTKILGPLVRNFSDFTLLEKRGSKKDGCVWRAISKTNGSVFAIKKCGTVPLNLQGLSESDGMREAMLLNKLTHTNILQLDGLTITQEQGVGILYLLLNPFVNMDLEYALTTKLTALQVKSMAYQLLLAVYYLHKQELVHRDIKPTSILMSEDYNLKLCSFGFCRSVRGDQSLDMFTPSHPINYTAPEIMSAQSESTPGKSINWKAADIWSTGCVLASLLMSGQSLFSGTDTSQYLKSVHNTLDSNPKDLSGMLGLYPDISNLAVSLGKSLYASHPSFRDGGVVDLVQSLLKFDPEERCSAANALRHKYFADIFNPLDISRGNDISLEVMDAVIPGFISEYCTGLV